MICSGCFRHFMILGFTSHERWGVPHHCMYFVIASCHYVKRLTSGPLVAGRIVKMSLSLISRAPLSRLAYIIAWMELGRTDACIAFLPLVLPSSQSSLFTFIPCVLSILLDSPIFKPGVFLTSASFWDHNVHKIGYLCCCADDYL